MTFKTSTYIKCAGIQIEKIGGRWRLAFVRCPKCRRYVNLYKDELNLNGDEVKTNSSKKCSCGMKTMYILEGWNKRK